MRTVFLLVLMLGAACADEEPLALKVLREKYEDSVNAAMMPINQRYIAKLDELLSAATKANRLDEALAIRAEKERMASNKAVSKEPKMMELEDTTWTWGKDDMVLRRDGTVVHPGWSHLRTTWTQIAPRVVQLAIAAGRSNDMIAVLVIATDGKSYSGTNFTGVKKIDGKRKP